MTCSHWTLNTILAIRTLITPALNNVAPDVWHWFLKKKIKMNLDDQKWIFILESNRKQPLIELQDSNYSKQQMHVQEAADLRALEEQEQSIRELEVYFQGFEIVLTRHYFNSIHFHFEAHKNHVSWNDSNSGYFSLYF